MCVCKLKNTAQSRIKYPTCHSIEQEVRHKVLSAVHLSVCAVRNLDKKAEKDKIKYNKLNHCFFFCFFFSTKSKRNKEVVRRRGITLLYYLKFNQESMKL